MSQLLQACLRNGKIFLPVAGLLSNRGPQIDSIFWLGYDNNMLLIAALFDQNLFPLVWGIKSQGDEPAESAHFFPGTGIPKIKQGKGWTRKVREVQTMREAWTAHVRDLSTMRLFERDNMLCRYYNHLRLSEFAINLRAIPGATGRKATPPSKPARGTNQAAPPANYPNLNHVIMELMPTVAPTYGPRIARRVSKRHKRAIARNRNAYIANVANQVGMTTSGVRLWLNKNQRYI
jgi:hypothetical protein